MKLNMSGFKFFSSPFFADEPGNWHIKEGAPQEIVDDFKRFKQITAVNPAPDVLLELSGDDVKSLQEEIKKLKDES